MTPRRWVSVIVVLGLFLAIAFAGKQSVRAACHPIPVTRYSPTGVAGCTLQGPTEGKVSWWTGDATAANWCTWPFTGCGSARVQSHLTGVTITVQIGMFGDLYTNTPRERLLDLTLAQVRALGLNPVDGVYSATVTPLPGAGGPDLPDTSMVR